MNFQSLNKIETPDFYLEIAFKNANLAAERERAKKDYKSFDRLNKSKNVELAKLQTMEDILCKAMTKILKAFPQIDDLPEFYQEMMKVTIDVALTKQSLGGVNWAWKRVHQLTKEYRIKIKRCKDLLTINKYRTQYMGRVSSTLKQIKKNLRVIDAARKVMKTYPNIKTNSAITTIALFGFPNVGKSTLLSKITTAKPEIKSYAFTTKRLNLGYVKSKTAGKRYQIIDTPGTLNRFDKMNLIEKQAHLALKHCAHKIIYIFDLTESSFPLTDQIKLFNTLKKNHKDKKILVYLSKTDLLEKGTVQEFAKKYKNTISSLEGLKKLLV